MDAKLRRELDAIARDNHSGAAELTLRAVDSIWRWLGRAQDPGESELLELARAILKAQPSMAPMLRLANEVALATDSPTPSTALHSRLRGLRRQVRIGPVAIARQFQRWMGRKRDVVVVTYSYSSTVVECLRRARTALHSVFCSEGRPAGEGLTMAEKLAQSGIKVTFCTDAALTGQVWPRQILMIGADAILPGCIASKVGTKALILLSQMRRCPVVVAADTLKFWPDSRNRRPRWDWKFGRDAELWTKPPKNVDVYNPYFELTFFRTSSRIRFLTEKGWMAPAQVRRELRKIRISPRLKSLVD